MSDAINPGMGYAGDVDPTQAWEMLKSDGGAVLVDVRTMPEWAYVGVPVLAEAGKELVTIQWQMFPTGEINPNFTAELAEAGVAKDSTVLFLCRSGARSRAAAIAATAGGFATCYNVAEGFEGDKDGHDHRGTVGGWKARGLPWAQS